ncbi:hypothetical protein H5410_042914 [Solanum commersonii]|uniref:Uncharacterized protein n=1 Tax=Solanum commersonii TaxID=4109 RepID=A0A9J5XYT9_SOLCO|nr:hypothetical protein H5410_042914 [Solanum commersonii]
MQIDIYYSKLVGKEGGTKVKIWKLSEFGEWLFCQLSQDTIPILDQSLKEGKINYAWLHQCGCEGITEGINTSGGCVYWSTSNYWRTLLSKQVRKHRHELNNSTIIRFNAKSNELDAFPAPEFIGEREFFLLSSLNGHLSLFGGNKKNRIEHLDHGTR